MEWIKNLINHMVVSHLHNRIDQVAECNRSNHQVNMVGNLLLLITSRNGMVKRVGVIKVEKEN